MSAVSRTSKIPLFLCFVLLCCTFMQLAYGVLCFVFCCGLCRRHPLVRLPKRLVGYDLSGQSNSNNLPATGKHHVE